MTKQKDTMLFLIELATRQLCERLGFKVDNAAPSHIQAIGDFRNDVRMILGGVKAK